MPQSIAYNYVHIITSTKHRQPFITPKIENDLYACIGGICKINCCQPIKIGGHLDHVHVLCSLSKNIALVKLVEEVKKQSSKWVKAFDTTLQNFYWQDGYGAFSINPNQLDTVISDINNQQQHHQRKTFQEEYLGFLRKYNVPHDERFIWD